MSHHTNQDATSELPLDNEWAIPTAEIPARQGDLLISRDPVKGQIEAILLIITADCDISKSKFGSHLACLQVVSYQQYIRTIWAARKLPRQIATALEKIQAQMNKWNSLRVGGQSALSADVIQEWVRRSKPEAIAQDLQVSEAEIPKFTKNLQTFRDALNALETTSASGQLAQYVSFRSVITGVPPAECLRQGIQQAIGEPLPEDAFFLPSLPQLDIRPAVVLLRELVAVPATRICFRTLDATSTEMFLRVGRLQPTFKYAISQAFGTLYSRIGLPKPFEDRCKAALEQTINLNWE